MASGEESKAGIMWTVQDHSRLQAGDSVVAAADISRRLFQVTTTGDPRDLTTYTYCERENILRSS